jgi:hypothetical protein
MEKDPLCPCALLAALAVPGVAEGRRRHGLERDRDDRDRDETPAR